MTDYSMILFDSSWQFLALMYSGGYVLWGIFILNIFLWMLVLERHWFIYQVFPILAKQTLNRWSKRQDTSSWYAKSIKVMMLASLKAKLIRHLNSIHVSVEILPILGLLGTVIGMIETFEVLNLYGTGNARALAASISKALITTLAGLISAIPGLFIYGLLQQQAEKRIQLLSEQMANL